MAAANRRLRREGLRSGQLISVLEEMFVPGGK